MSESMGQPFDEHWHADAVAAVRSYRMDDHEGWIAYLNDADELASADASITEEWTQSS